MSRIPVVVNPVAGGGRLVRLRPELDAVARGLGVELEWCLTERPGHAGELAREAAARGASMVLAYGGDGTYNEVARGLVGSDTALGALPGGTSSVLAYELGIPRPAPRALTALVAGSNRPMHPGRSDRGDLFLLMLSAGPDALVLSHLGSRLKRVGGRAGVAAAAAREVLRRRPLPRLTCRIDGELVDGGWVIVGRSRCYAGPFHAVPEADPFGTGLQMVVQRRTGRWPAVGFALAMPFRAHVRRGDVVCRHATEIDLEPVEESQRVPYQVDGDLVGVLPVRVDVDHRTLTIRVPTSG